jgi:hypothetical protein
MDVTAASNLYRGGGVRRRVGTTQGTSQVMDVTAGFKLYTLPPPHLRRPHRRKDLVRRRVVSYPLQYRLRHAKPRGDDLLAKIHARFDYDVKRDHLGVAVKVAFENPNFETGFSLTSSAQGLKPGGFQANGST